MPEFNILHGKIIIECTIVPRRLRLNWPETIAEQETIGMFMWRQLFRWGTIIGLCLAGSVEVEYT